MFEKGIVGKIEITPGDKLFPHFLEIKLSIGRKWRTTQPNRLFVPLSPTQIQKLAQVAPPGEIGGIRLGLFTKEKTLSWLGFYPFSSIPKGQEPYRVGIGTAVQHAVVEHLAKRFKGFEILHGSIDTLPGRTNQLKQMDISVEERYRIEEYLAKVRSYVERRKKASAVSKS